MLKIMDKLQRYTSEGGRKSFSQESIFWWEKCVPDD